MTTTKRNYFKNANGDLFFFAAGSPESAQDAFERARRDGSSICIFNITPFPGPWDRVSLIGHRSRSEILQDLNRTKDSDKAFWLKEECDQLDACYQSAGRAVPMTSVAA